MAYKWLNLAAAQNHTQSIKARNEVAEHMTPAQIAEAQKLVKSPFFTRNWHLFIAII
jgi:hypothetical protein